MAYAIAAIIAFGVVQFFWSIRFAYRLERDQLAVGYPIFGHVLHTVCIILIVGVLAGKTLQLPTGVRLPIAMTCLALPLIHAWLLLRYTKHGERAFLRQPGEGNRACTKRTS